MSGEPGRPGATAGESLPGAPGAPGAPAPSATATDAEPALGGRPPRGRIGGIDAARALAIVGMVMVHFGPVRGDPEALAGRLYALVHGRASILFVLLAGVGVSLLAGGRSPTRRRRALATLLWRTAVLLPVGLALQTLDHGVLVILQYYAVYFLVAAAAVPLADRALLGGSLLAAVAGPLVHVAAWMRTPEWFSRAPAELGDPLGTVAVDLLLAGSYPVVTWTAPLLFGMWLGRRDLRSPRVRLGLVVGGAVVALAAHLLSTWLGGLLDGLPDGLAGAAVAEPSWQQLAVQEPHSQMPLWLIGSSGAAALLLGTALVAVDRLRRALWPLVALGQLALTVYVTHLFVLAEWPHLLRRDDVGPAFLSVARFAAVSAALAVLWLHLLPRGPLEMVLRVPRLWPRRA